MALLLGTNANLLDIKKHVHTQPVLRTTVDITLRTLGYAVPAELNYTDTYYFLSRVAAATLSELTGGGKQGEAKPAATFAATGATLTEHARRAFEMTVRAQLADIPSRKASRILSTLYETYQNDPGDPAAVRQAVQVLLT